MISFLKKITPLLLNPFLLALVPAVVITWLLPIKHERYMIEIQQERRLQNDQYIYYYDVTGDGYSEQIVFIETPAVSGFAFRNQQNRTYDQWNLHGEFPGVHKLHFFSVGDYDQDGRKEIYVFTQSNDSLFLHGLSYIYLDTLFIKDRFVTTFGPGQNTPDLSLISPQMADLNGDGNMELIFGITTGFSLFPRNIFAYYINQDSLVMSPESYFCISHFELADVTGDGFKEIILSGYAPANVSPRETTYHDHSNWVMVLDRNLQFLFEPIEMPGRFSAVRSVVAEIENQKRIKVFHLLLKENKSVVYTFDHFGQLHTQNSLSGNPFDVFKSIDNNGTVMYGLMDFDGHVSFLDKCFSSPKNTYKTGGVFSYFGQFCLGHKTNDLINVMTFWDSQRVVVFRNDLRDPLSIPINWNSDGPARLSLKLNGEEPPQISLQLGQNHYLLYYGLNPMYYLNIGIYLLIYAGVLAFTFLIRGVQRRQLLKQQETEKRITELQINLVKNKLDPHFSINALNSVIQAIRDNRHEVAEDGLLQFVGMYRNMMLSADSVDRSLDEELAFTKSYLNLEKLRYDGLFDYAIEVAPGVDHSTPVPKMIVQIHAENAVKHGLAPLKSGGRLHIAVGQQQGNLQIVITDNGIGFTKGKEASRSRRSQGLDMMQDLYTLYHKVSKRLIKSEIEELNNDRGEIVGTRVRIQIRHHMTV